MLSLIFSTRYWNGEKIVRKPPRCARNSRYRIYLDSVFVFFSLSITLLHWIFLYHLAADAIDSMHSQSQHWRHREVWHGALKETNWIQFDSRCMCIFHWHEENKSARVFTASKFVCISYIENIMWKYTHTHPSPMSNRLYWETVRCTGTAEKREKDNQDSNGNSTVATMFKRFFSIKLLDVAIVNVASIIVCTSSNSKQQLHIWSRIRWIENKWNDFTQQIQLWHVGKCMRFIINRTIHATTIATKRCAKICESSNIVR